MQLQDDVGLWAERRTRLDFAGRPALFLDRDGVIVEEVNYLGHPGDVRMVPGAVGAIAAVNREGLPVVLVTNQAGVGRGYYDWDGFAAVQARIADELAREGAALDMVLACAHHEDGRGPFRQSDHPWRKPGCGMLTHARDILNIDLTSSYIVGDKVSDLEAGVRAGLPCGALVLTGHGRGDLPLFESRRREWERLGTFLARTFDDLPQAIDHWLRQVTERLGSSLGWLRG